MSESRLKLLGAWMVLMAIAVISHHCFIAVAPELWSWDSGPYLLVAEDVLRGKITAFYYNHYYGGAVLGWVHGAWLGLAKLFSTDRLFNHHTFHYYFVPGLLTTSTFFMLLQFNSLVSAFVTSLIPAVGVLSWILFYSSTEYYIAGYVMGCTLLALRIRWGEPLQIRSPLRQLIFFSLVGFSIYTYRATLVYAVGLVVPMNWVIAQIRLVYSSPSLIAKRARVLIYSLLGLYLALDLLGPRIGTWNGKNVKLNALPNLKIAIVLTALLWLWLKRDQIKWGRFRDYALIPIGLILGFLPELISHIGRAPAFDDGGGARLANLKNSLETVVALPDRLRELLTSTVETPLGSVGQTPLHFASLALVILSIWAINRHVRQNRGHSFLQFSLVLAALTFCLITSYAMGYTRWLFSSLPILFVGTAFWFESQVKSGKSRLVLACLILMLHFGNQALGRSTLIRFIGERPEKLFTWTMGRMGEMQEAVQLFKDLNVRLVISDTYFWSNNLTVLSNREPLFVSKEWSPIRDYEQLKNESRVGLILGPDTGFPFVYQGQTYDNPTKIGTIEDRVLYTASLVSGS